MKDLRFVDDMLSNIDKELIKYSFFSEPFFEKLFNKVYQFIEIKELELKEKVEVMEYVGKKIEELEKN